VAAATIRPTGAAAPGEVIVKLQAGASTVDVANIEQQADADQDDQLSDVGSGAIWRIRSRSKSTDQLIGTLRSHPKVVYVEPNYVVHAFATPNDTRYAELWGMKNTGQTLTCGASCYGSPTGTAGADIKAEAAWSVTTGSRSIIVGVVDTGVDYTHNDLAANIWSNPGGIGGCAAGTHGYNAITKTCDPRDDHYHGTHCSGTIGAVGNNALGVVGVNWVTSIMGLKFLDASGSGTTADAITAIDFAVNAKIAGQNVRVLSNSWGGGGFSQALLDEINKANTNDIMFVAAAGNASTNNDVTPNYPSNYNAPNVVAVAATDNTDGLAAFSNYGATTVHLGAPGVDILSCQPGNLYQYLSGTSMATPHVAGVAALVLSKTPTLTTAQLKSTILTNTDPIPSLSGRTTTGGRLNASKAVGTTPPPPDYSLSISPSSATVTAGASASYTVNITRTGGFTGSVSFAISGLPSGAAGTFNPNPATGASSALTVTTSSTTPAGSYVFTVTGTSGTLSHTATATLVVQGPATPNFTLSISPASQTVPATGGSAAYTVTITRSGGFTAAVTLSVSGLPAGATGSFNPNNTTGNTSTLTVTVAASTAAGTYVFTVTGTGGSPTLTRTATATLIKSAPACTDGNCQN
jgi:subtilisin family serine protease